MRWNYKLFDVEHDGGQPGTDAPPAANENSQPGAGQPAPDAPPAADAPPAPQPYYPDNLAENLRGKDDKETIDRLAKAVAGYRNRDSKNNVPKNIEEYYDFADTDIPDDVQAYFKDLKDDPIYQSLAREALQNNVPKSVLQKITTAAFQAAYESGVLEPPLDVAKERAALIPPDYQNAGKAAQDKAIDARMQANEDFVKLLVKDGKLDKDVGEYSLLMLMDSAAGNKFLEAFRNFATRGDQAGPIAGGGMSSGDDLAALRQECWNCSKSAMSRALPKKWKRLMPVMNR